LISLVTFGNAYSFYGNYFIKNFGQWDSKVLYVASKPNYNFIVTQDALMCDYFEISQNGNNRRKNGQVVKINFENAGILGSRVELGRSSWRLNYLIGNNPSRWKTDVYGIEEITFHEIYSNVDLAVKFQGDVPRYDFIVKPGGDISQIKISFDGAEVVGTDGKNIKLHTRFGEVINGNLFAYQVENGVFAEVECKFVQTSSNQFSFEVGEYDRSKELIIDPIVMQSYFGGNANDEFICAVEASTGILVATGWTESVNFPTTPGTYDVDYNDARDVFISKFDVTGSKRELIFSTFLGGGAIDYPAGLSVGESGSIYVAGSTNSADFPLYQSIGTSINGGYDIFVTKLTSDGKSLVYSTYVGGNKDDIATAAKLATDKGVFVTGYTTSTNFPVTGGAYQSKLKGREDIFILKLSSSGKTIEQATYIGGSDDDRAYAMAVSVANTAFIVGATKSGDFPMVPYRTGTGGRILDSPYDRTYNGGWDVAVIKFLGDGGKVDYSTYFGGSADDIGRAVTFTADQRIIFAGETYKESITTPSFPISNNAYQATHKGNAEVFIASLSNIIEGRDQWGNTTRRQDLVFSTFMGGSGNEYPSTIGIFPGNQTLIISGYTNSANFPIVNNPSGRRIGKYDLFYVNMSLDGSSVLFSDLLGTADDDSTKAFFKADNGDYYFAATTNSKNMTQIYPLQGASYSGLNDGLIIKYSTTDLSLDNPVGREELCPGSTLNIRWSSETFSANDTFDIQVKKGSTSDWQPLVSNVKGFKYSWVIPQDFFAEQVWLRITHKRGIIVPMSVSFTIYELPSILSVTQTPSIGSFCEGDSVVFKVQAKGSKLKYQWMFNGNLMSGSTDTVLTIRNLSESNSGQYKVIVSGPCPTTAESQSLQIDVKPTTKILSNSQDTVVKIKETLRLYVIAKGHNLTYQWFKDGMKLLGQTQKEFITEQVSILDKGAYKCLVYGSCGLDSTSTINVDIDTTISNVESSLEANNDVFIFINSDYTELKILSTSPLNHNNVIFFNPIGQMLSVPCLESSESISGCTFDVSNLSIGYYYVLVKGQSKSKVLGFSIVR
jgi:hypothetical protein